MLIDILTDILIPGNRNIIIKSNFEICFQRQMGMKKLTTVSILLIPEGS